MSNVTGTAQQQTDGKGAGAPPPATPEELNLADEAKEDAELWAELDAAEAAAAPDAETDPLAADEAAAEKPAKDAANAKDGAEAAAEKAKPGEAAPSTEKGQDAGKAADKGAPADDIWATATPAQRAAFEAAQAQVKSVEHAHKSDRGRLSSLQRELNELRNRQPGDAGKPGKGKGAEALLDDEEWKTFVKEYPEVAAPLAKLVSKLELTVADTKKVTDAIREDRRQADLDARVKALDAKAPDWRDVVADQDAYGAWLQSQPRHIQEAAARNADEIVDADEAADVIGRFKAYRSSQAGSNAPANGPEAGGNADTGKTVSLSGKRQRQLDASSSARSGGPGAARGLPDNADDETAWKYFDELDRQREARRA